MKLYELRDEDAFFTGAFDDGPFEEPEQPEPEPADVPLLSKREEDACADLHHGERETERDRERP